jgi:hypothetical protein
LWRYSFADFVVGPPNHMAVAAAQDMSQRGGCEQTLFVSSASGLGKTHLAPAVGRAIADQGDVARVGYLTAEEFATRFVCSLKSHDVEGFKSRFRDLDVLLMEDVHFFQGKEKMQDMALAVVKNLQARGGRVIFTSSFSRASSSMWTASWCPTSVPASSPIWAAPQRKCVATFWNARPAAFRCCCPTPFASSWPAASAATCVSWNPASTA